MDQQLLHAAIKKVSRKITEDDLPFLASCAQYRQLSKGAVLLKEGEVCRSFYLVETGYLRTYYYKDGLPINSNFTFEGDFATDTQSLNNRQPSTQIIEAGEPTTIWVFNLDVASNEFNANPEIILFLRRLAVHVLILSEQYSNLFKRYTPAERYHYIEQHNPQLLQRISLSQIASYLGVARETLSRIRAKHP